uniref:Testis expressed 9 n=1 Tax=Fundulus heteroclitus TaxID=8078 RepID=A0A3Q2PTC8_FUNHE
MAERSGKKKVNGVISQTKKRPSSSSTCRADRSRKAEPKPASDPKKTHTDELFAKEEQYKLLNAELEAKTAELVRQADELMREQKEDLSSLSNVLLLDTDDEDDFKKPKSQPRTLRDPGMKVNKKKVTPATQSTHAGKQGTKPRCKTATSDGSPHAEDSAALEDEAELFLAKTIRSMEEKMKHSVQENTEDNAEDHVGSAASDAQTRVLKAKLRIMQEELDLLSCDYYKKDDENAKLTATVKELEEDRARLQRAVGIQQTQTEKQRALAEELAKKCDNLQLQVSALSKEVETLTRSQKQAAAVHGTVEVRLNRALEEVEKLKSQLSKTRQINKDKISEEHQSKENLLAENQTLKKQKAELIVAFKKQLKLIDILKKQKMHFEAAKLLSFTEEEFLKALDWGKA